MKRNKKCAENPVSIEKYQEKIPDIVEKIVDSCRLKNNYEHVDTSLIPSRESIIDIIELIKDILFPGYYGNQELTCHNMKFHIGEEVNVLFKKLSDQITRSIKHDCLRYDRECSDCVETGFSKALLFLEKIVYLREMLAKDVRAAIDGDPAAKSPDEVIFSYPGFFAIMIYRIAHELFKMEIPIMPRIMTEYAHSQTGVDIHPGASIDESFFIDHGTGVVIGETTIIGKKVRVYQGVTLGALSIKKLEDGSFDLKTKRHPTIEDEAILYSNCTILGGKTVIGKKAVIGGNVWVTESVPPGSVIIKER